jgi:hypothetical protein
MYSDNARRVREAIKKRSSKEFINHEIERQITEYFSPTPPPDDLSQEQIDKIVEALLGPE